MRLPTLIFAAIAATPAFAIDDCIVGRWQVDTNDMAQVLATQMSGEASYVSGGVTMQVSIDGDIALVVRDLTIKVKVPNTPAMDVAVNGSSRGTIIAENGGWTLTVVDYALTGSADVMGSTMTIPFNSASGMFGGGTGNYVCNGDLLTFDNAGSTPRLPRRWSRAG